MPKATTSVGKAAIDALCNSTTYRVLVSPNGARMTPRTTRSSSGGRAVASAATPCSTCSTAAAADRRGILARGGRLPRRSSASRPSSTGQGDQLPLLVRRHTQDESDGAASARTSTAWSAAARDRLRRPRRRTMRASIFACKRPHDRDLRRHLGLRRLSTTTVASDEARPSRARAQPTTARRGTQPADLAARCSSRYGRPCTRYAGRRGRVQVHHDLHEGKIRVLSSLPKKVSASTIPPCGPRSARTASRYSAGTAHEATPC